LIAESKASTWFKIKKSTGSVASSAITLTEEMKELKCALCKTKIGRNGESWSVTWCAGHQVCYPCRWTLDADYYDPQLKRYRNLLFDEFNANVKRTQNEL
jgi:hypothetical protein